MATTMQTTASLASTCLLLFLAFSPTTKAQPPFSCYPRGTNYTRGSRYESNLNRTLTSLVSNIPRNGFNTIALGTTPDTVYGLLQCRGDVSYKDCQTCANISAIQIIQLCPYHKEAVVFNDDCLLHYAGFPFFSSTSSDPTIFLVNTLNVSDPVVFNSKVGKLMKDLSTKASSDPSKFDTGMTGFSKSINIYGLVQCTRDLSETSCLACLQAMVSYIPRCCGGKQGGRVLSTSCYIRYEIYPFFLKGRLQ